MIVSEKKVSICQSKDVAELLHLILSHEDQTSQEREHFWSIGLNVKHITKYIELVSLGSLSASLVHPREIFRMSIEKGVAGLIFVHNHPSGDSRPSQEDILLTRRLINAGDLLGIKIYDHIILGELKSYYSFSDSGLMTKSL